MPAHLAALVAALPALLAAPAIVRLATASGVAVDVASSAWAGVGESFAIDPLHAASIAIPPQGAWGARAVAALDDDLAALQARLAAQVLAGGISAAALLERCGPAGGRAVALAREAAAMPDLAAATVALRALHGIVPQP